MRTAKQGDTVKVNYTGYLRDRSIFASTIDSEPMRITIGEGNLIPVIEQALIGMAPGDSKTLRIIPDREAGPSQKNIIREEQSGTMPEHEKRGRDIQDFETFFTEGETIGVNVDNPMSYRVRADDLNLTGKELFYDIEVAEIE